MNSCAHLIFRFVDKISNRIDILNREMMWFRMKFKTILGLGSRLSKIKLLDIIVIILFSDKIKFILFDQFMCDNIS